MMKIVKYWFIAVGTLTVLCLIILLCIFVTELDIRNIEKEQEYQKLRYYQTLNRIYEEYDYE